MRNFVGLLLLVVMGVSCHTETVPEPDPEMSFTAVEECKFQDPLKGDSPGPDQTCVIWTYDAEHTLELTHVNAGFNCCPEKILTSMRISSDTIYLTEWDSLQLCKCLCLYDIDFVIQNLPPQKYVMLFEEPYVTPPKQPLVFTIDLMDAVSGELCQDRDYYPWGTQW